MKAETMASENLKRAVTDTTFVRRRMREGRRATTHAGIPNGGQEILRPSGRRKLSVDNDPRNLFPMASRINYDDVLPAEDSTSTKVDQPVKLQMGERELGQKPVTIMSVLRRNLEKFPDRQAYAYKPDDTWQYITYKDLFDLVRRAAKGFISFGLQRFSGVAIIGRNAPEWVIANFAAIYAGGIVVPISTAVSADDCCSMMQNTRCSIIVVGSSKELVTVAQIRNQLPSIQAIIKYGKDDGAKSVSFHTWEQLLAMGERVDDERLKERIAFQAPNLCCSVIHTPGTTGPPKPVMLSQDNFVWTARTMGRRLSCDVASGLVMCIMPYAHISALIFSLYMPLLFASTVYFISSPNVFEWTREVQPTMLHAPFLVFEELRLKMTAHLTRFRFARIIYWWAKSVGLRGYRAITRRRPMPICWSLANALVYQKIRSNLGLRNIREIFIAGRKISLQALEFFASFNIPVLEVYGMTEATGPITVSAIPDMFRITSVGKDMDGCSTKIIQPDKNGVGNIRLRGRHLFMGYLNQPAMTNKAFDNEGWFITDDLARKDEDGFLYITGKASDSVILANGESIPSGSIETGVREALPFIRNCMLVGNGRTYLAMLLTIKTVVDWQTYEVSNTLTPDSRQWFQKLGYKDESIDQFLQNPDKRILDKIQSLIDRLNATAQPSHKLQKWTILPKDFSIRGGEINWTLRVRRFYVEKMYAETIESLYVDK